MSGNAVVLLVLDGVLLLPPPTTWTFLSRFSPAGSVYSTAAWKSLICWPSFVVALMTMIGETYRTISKSLTSWSSVPSLTVRPSTSGPSFPIRCRVVACSLVEMSSWTCSRPCGTFSREPALGIGVGLGVPGRAVDAAEDGAAPAPLGLALAIDPVPLDHDRGQRTDLQRGGGLALLDRQLRGGEDLGQWPVGPVDLPIAIVVGLAGSDAVFPRGQRSEGEPPVEVGLRHPSDDVGDEPQVFLLQIRPVPALPLDLDEHALDRLALDIQDPAGHGDALLQGDRPHVASLPVGDHVQLDGIILGQDPVRRLAGRGDRQPEPALGVGLGPGEGAVLERAPALSVRE